MWQLLQRGGGASTPAASNSSSSSSGATPLLVGCAAVQQRRRQPLLAAPTAPAPAAATAAAWDSGSSAGQAVLTQHQLRQSSTGASRRPAPDYAAQPRLLTAHIKQCDAWQQLPVLLDAAGSHAVNHIHLAAALTHAAQLQQQQQQGGAAALQWALQASQQLVQQHADSLEARHAANTLWALAALARGAPSTHRSQVPPALLDELLLVQQRLWQQQQQLSSIKLQDCSNSLWALATLQHQPPPSWLADVWAVSLQQLATASATSSNSNSLQEVANLLWAAAALRLQPPEQWVAACLAAAAAAAAAVAGSQAHVAEAAGRASSSRQQRAHGGSAHALANIAYVLARLQYQPDAAWVAHYLSTSRAVLQQCSPAHLCMMLWGVATWDCRCAPPEPAAAVNGDAESSCSSSSSQTRPDAAALLQEWMVACSSAVQQQLPGFSDHGLVGAAVSCHKLLLHVQRAQQQQQQPALLSTVSQLLGVLLDAAAGRMQAMQPAWVGALVWASAGLEQAGTLPAHGRQQQAGVGVQQLQPQQLREYLQHAMAGAQAGSQGPDTLVCLLFLAAKARCLPASAGAWLQRHVPQLQQQLASLRPPQLAQLCWSLAVLLELQRAQPSWQQQQQQQQEWLVVLASSLLQQLPPALGSMSQAELLEAASSAARITAAVQALQAGTSTSSSSSSRDAGLLPAVAAAATPLTALLHPRQLLQLAHAVRLLLKCSTGVLPRSAADLRAVHTWLDAAAQRLQAHLSAGLPPAAAGQLAVQLLAVGKAAAGQPASRAGRAGNQQQQQQPESREPDHAWCAALQDVLAQTVHQLQGPAALQLAALSVRLKCALPAGVLCDLLYSLAAAVPSCSSAALQELLRLLPAWRSVPPAATAARKALLRALLGATEQRLSAQLHHLQADRSISTAEIACDAAEYLQLVARSRLRPPQGWLAVAVGCLLYQLPGMPADAVSRVPLWLAMVDAQLEAPVQQQLLQTTQVLLPQLGRSQLVRVVHGLSRLGAAPADDWLAALYARAESAPGAFQPSGFGMVVWGLARFGARPEAAWMSGQLDATFGGDDAAAAAAEPGQQQAQLLTPQHLANMLCAFAKLGFTPGQRWMAWFAAALSQAGGAMQELDHFHIEWAWRELAEGRHRQQLEVEGGGG